MPVCVCAYVYVCLCLCVLHMCRAEQQQTQRCHCHHASLASLQPLVADDGLRRLPAHPAPPVPTPSCLCLVFTSLSQPNRRLYYFPFVIVLFSYDFPFLLYLFNFFCRLPSPAYAEQSPTPPPCRQLPLCALSFSPLLTVCPSLSPSLFYSLLFGFSFCSLCFKLGTSFAFLSFFLCYFPSIFPFFVCCAAVTFGHHHYHLPPSEPFCSPLPRPAHHHHHLWLLWPLLLQSECAPFLLFFAHTTSF